MAVFDEKEGQGVFQGKKAGVFSQSANAGIDDFTEIAKRNPELDPNNTSNLFQNILSGLSILNRPLSTVAGFAKGVADDGLGKGLSNAYKGLSGEKHYGFSDVLKSLGAGKLGSVEVPVLGKVTGRGVAGFALDVLLDPLQLVKITGLTKAALDVTGLRKPTILPATVFEKVGETKQAFENLVGLRKAAIIKRVTREVDSLRVPKAGKAAADFVNIPADYGELGSLSYEITGPVSKEVAEGTLQKGVMNAEYRLADLRQTRINEAMTRFNDEVLPTLKSRFVDKKSVELLADPEISKHIKVSSLLDDVIGQNMTTAQIIRNAHLKSNTVVGAYLTDAIEKGYRSLITLGDYSPAEIAKNIGLPEIAVSSLQRADKMVAAGLRKVGDYIGDKAIFKQIRAAFNAGTGVKELDILLSKMKGTAQGKNAAAIRKAFALVQEGDDIYKKLDPASRLDFMREVTDFLEEGNPHNNLSHHSTKAYKPGVVAFGNKLKEALDQTYRAENISGSALGHMNRYIKGYFPRELTPQIKELMGEALEEGDIFRLMKPKYRKMRKLEFQRLSTTEINDLFRDNRLGFEKLVNAMQNPDKLKKLGVLDAEMQEYFISDPAMAVANRLIRSTKAISEKEQTASLLKFFGTNVFDKSAELLPGEALFSPLEFFKDPEFARLNKKQTRAMLQKLFPGEKWTRKNVNNLFTAARAIKSEDLARLTTSEVGNPLAEKVIKDIASLPGMDQGIAEKAVNLFTELPLMHPNLFAQMSNIGVPVYKAPKEVVKAINQWWRVNNDPKTYNALKHGWDGITNFFKRTTTTIFPSSHFRNLTSDLYQNYLAGINPIIEMGHPNGAYRLAGETLKSYNVLGRAKNFENSIINGADDLVGRTLVTNSGEKIPMEQVFSMFLKEGGTSGIIRDSQILDSTPVDEITSKLRGFWESAKLGESGKFNAQRLNPLSKDFAPVALGNRAAEVVSIHNRFAHFIHKIKEGFTPDEAMLSVKKYLFDYEDLSNFERNTLRRVFPFYTWSRKNIPLQLQTFLTDPSKTMNAVKAAKMLENETLRNDIGEDNIPSYIKKEWGIVTKKNSNGTYDFLMLGSYIPAADLLKLGSTKDFFRLATKSLHPVPQAIIESNINRNFFSERPIKTPGKTTGTFLETTMDLNLINTLKKVRVLNTADKLFTKDDPDNPYFRKTQTVPEKLVSNITGLNQRKVDIDKIAASEERLDRLIGLKLKAALEKANRIGDTAAVESIRKMMEQK